EGLRRQRTRSERERLRGRSLLAVDVAGRNPALLDSEDGLAVGAIQNKQVAALGPGGDGGNGAAVAVNVEQDRRRRDVVIPEVVVDGLEMPYALAGIGA